MHTAGIGAPVRLALPPCPFRPQIEPCLPTEAAEKHPKGVPAGARDCPAPLRGAGRAALGRAALRVRDLRPIGPARVSTPEGSRTLAGG